MTRDIAMVQNRLVDTLPWACIGGATMMAGLRWVLRRRLAPIDRLAFALDAAGYVAAVVPTSRRHPSGWWTLALLTAVQPLFSLAKQIDGSGSRRELAGRTASTIAVLSGLIWLKPPYDAARLSRTPT